MRWFHGGTSGLQVGDMILPPDETGVESPAGWIGISRTDRVYVTENLDDAIVYAGLVSDQGGSVYRVHPLGLREREHDFSEHAALARVTAVEIERVSVRQAREAMLRIQPELVELIASETGPNPLRDGALR